jgi:hypothetical protein
MAHASMSEFNEMVGIPSWHRSLVVEERAMTTVIGFAEPDVCYPALEGADANQDRLVDQQEYVDFCKLMGPQGFLNGLQTFEDLPLQLQSNFFVLACLCKTDSGDDSCCVGDAAGIRADGAYEQDIPTPEQESYLFVVCSLTASAVERVLRSAPPSPEPSASPTSTPSWMPSSPPSGTPTDAPTVTPGTPTAAPTTPAPTTSPSSPPTVEPTASPPTQRPTTAAPTPAPEPTPAPQPIEEQVTTVYRIGIEFGSTVEQTTYEPQLVDAMDSLAPEVLASVLDSLRRRLKGHKRRLQSVGFPTTIDTIQDVGKCVSGGGLRGCLCDMTLTFAVCVLPLSAFRLPGSHS